MGRVGEEERSEGRMGRGWRLTRAAWALMRRGPTMIYLACWAPAARSSDGGPLLARSPDAFHVAIAWLIALYPLTFVGVFFNVALAAAAGAHFEGRRLTLGEALRAAYDRTTVSPYGRCSRRPSDCCSAKSPIACPAARGWRAG
ncbi:MAG TPA: hypothetical protein VFN89_03360 [Solirubrobacterales bacterium]|nr:hypothetical protein [Solirubrobacterales bacterium]